MAKIFTVKNNPNDVNDREMVIVHIEVMMRISFFIALFCSLGSLSASLWPSNEEMPASDVRAYGDLSSNQMERSDMDPNNKLAKKKCIPCRGGVPPLKGEELNMLLGQLQEGWKVVDGHHLEREYRFPDFKGALAFTNRVGEIAELEGHHPDIFLSWGRVKIQLWTHKINGLTESDFILAAKCDQVL